MGAKERDYEPRRDACGAAALQQRQRHQRTGYLHHFSADCQRKPGAHGWLRVLRRLTCARKDLNGLDTPSRIPTWCRAAAGDNAPALSLKADHPLARAFKEGVPVMHALPAAAAGSLRRCVSAAVGAQAAPVCVSSHLWRQHKHVLAGRPHCNALPARVRRQESVGPERHRGAGVSL